MLVRGNRTLARGLVASIALMGISLAVSTFGSQRSIATVKPKGQTTNSSSAKTKTNSKATKKPAVNSTTPKTTSPKDTQGWRVIGVSAKTLTEVSGCAFSRRDAKRVWLHNDSGDGPNVVPVDITSGAVGKLVSLAGVEINDPEDIAMTSNGDLILADIGDNNEKRDSIQLYRFAEPALNATRAQARRLDLTYPDGPHNAEALVVSSDASYAYIFTKDPSGVADVFQANLNTENSQVLTKVGQVTITGEFPIKPNLISAADAVGSKVILRSFQHGYLLTIPSGGQFADALKGPPQRFDVPLMVQGEAICASPDGRTLVTASESQGAATFALAVGPIPG